MIVVLHRGLIQFGYGSSDGLKTPATCFPGKVLYNLGCQRKGNNASRIQSNSSLYYCCLFVDFIFLVVLFEKLKDSFVWNFSSVSTLEIKHVTS